MSRENAKVVHLDTTRYALSSSCSRGTPRRERELESGADGAQAMDNFFQTVYQAVLRLLPFQTLKAIVIASPGFTKDSVRPELFLPCPWLRLCSQPQYGSHPGLEPLYWDKADSLTTAIRLHLPAGHPDVKQTAVSVPLEMDQSALEYPACPLARRGDESAGDQQDAPRGEVCEGGSGLREVR